MGLERMGRAALVAVVLVAAVIAPVASGATEARVTLIGDSVADALEHNPRAIAGLNEGFIVNLQTRGCRRLRAPGCTIVGTSGPPSTTLEVVRRLGGSLGRIVVVDVGYNDTPTAYGRDLAAVMRALENVGVETVIWLTLRDPDRVYAPSNAEIRSAAEEWAELFVADWDEYSDGHSAWFQADGIHLTELGATELATFINRALVRHAPSGSSLPAALWRR